jgi:MFS family permease
MYHVESSGALVRAHRALLRGRRTSVVSRTVILLGVCSLLTDISSEMVTAVLPIYLVGTLGFGPMQIAVVDGIYQGATGVVRILAGYMGDRLGRHKLVASAGYGLSAFCKLALALLGSAFGALSAVMLVDRTGKGIRTAPRDAMISMSSEPEKLGTAFGVHRAMDTTGALLGPLVAFGLLALAPTAFRSVFLVSFFFGIVGLAVLVLLVDEPRRARRRAEAAAEEERISLRAAVKTLNTPGFRRLAGAAVLLSVTTASDAFIYLALQEQLDLDTMLFPLLATGTAVTYMSLAAPLGRLADRIGRHRVFLGGYVMLLAAYVALVAGLPGAVGIVIVLFLLGTYYAATDGVLMALGSAHVSDEMRGSGLAVLGTATSVSRLGASLVFGVLWAALGIETAFLCFAVGLAVTIPLTRWMLGRSSAHA